MATRHIVLGVTGSIAAYKAADIVRRLQEKGCEVTVLMTPGAEKFITPLTFEALTHRPVYRDMFKHEGAWDIAHVSVSRRADLFLIAPATADIISKIACGIADDFVSCMAMTTKAPILMAPAMNTQMWENRILQQNVARLEEQGVIFVAPKEGRLACDAVGKGALADVDVIIGAVEGSLK